MYHATQRHTQVIVVRHQSPHQIAIGSFRVTHILILCEVKCCLASVICILYKDEVVGTLSVGRTFELGYKE
jgi:hypothetical protein